MIKIALSIAAAAALMTAQPYRDLLLATPRHVAGVVVDQSGNPVAEARIDHTGDLHKAHQTDLEGRFELDTVAPAVVVRKTGYRSVLMRTQDAAAEHVVLTKLAGGHGFPTCSNTGQYDGIGGWRVSFWFLKTPGVKASRLSHDIDYSERIYYLKSQGRRRGIAHGSGPNWSLGVPLDRDVWTSAKYEEVAYDADGITIIDARGQTTSGKCWRNLSKFGESASYYDMDKDIAKILDRFLDGVCLKFSQQR